jgi:hypothetical protein
MKPVYSGRKKIRQNWTDSGAIFTKILRKAGVDSNQVYCKRNVLNFEGAPNRPQAYSADCAAPAWCNCPYHLDCAIHYNWLTIGIVQGFSSWAVVESNPRPVVVCVGAENVGGIH